MLNAGAILSAGVAATLVEPDMTNSEKFDYIQQYFKVRILYIEHARTYLQLPLRQWGAGNVYFLVLHSRIFPYLMCVRVSVSSLKEMVKKL